MAEKSFPTKDVVGAVTGRLLGDIGGIYEVCSFMTGQTMFTHQLPRAGRCIKAAMLKRDHDLWTGLIDRVGRVTRDNYKDFVAEIELELGPTMVVAPLDAGEYLVKDPIKEAEDIING